MHLAGLILLIGATMAPALAAPRGNPGRMETLTGTVTAVDTTAGTVTLQYRSRGLAPAITLTVSATTPIILHSVVGPAQLLVGDNIQVAGIPIVLNAQAIKAGVDVRTGITPPPTPTNGGTTGGTTGTGGTTTPTLLPIAGASAAGTIKTIDPTTHQLTVVLADNTTIITVNVPADLQINRTDKVDLTGVKVGDLANATVLVQGRTGLATLTALEVMAPPATTTPTTTPTPPANGG
jgi:hypothetical protein